MKSNFNSLTDFAKEIERIEGSKADFLVPQSEMLMKEDEFISFNEDEVVMSDFAHGQLAAKMGIPKKYYDKTAEIEGLRTLNVNAWLRKNQEKSLFVRTLDGQARAILSNSFRPIDNYDILESFFPAVKDMELQIKSSSLSEKKMYLQLVFPKHEMEVTQGDVVQQGIILTNSEIGAGAVDIKHIVWRLVCSNGLIGESVMRKYHIGSRMDASQSDIYKDDTIRAELDSFKLRLRDVLADAISEVKFNEQVQALKLATEDSIGSVSKTVQEVTKRFGLSESLNDSIIQNMVEEKNLNRYGLANGITHLAHELENVDAQYEVEKVGSKIINMTRGEWGKFVAEVA